MSGINTSIYDTIKGPQQSAPQNPLTTLGSAASTINALNQNAMFQQMFQARQAIGPIYQQSIDPTTGELDTNKLMSLAARDPRTAWMAGDIAQQALTRRAQELEIGTRQFDLASKHVSALADILGPVAANPNASMSDLTQATAKAVALGLVSPKEAAAEALSWPSGPGGQMTSDQVRQTVNGYLLRGRDSLQKIQAIYGLPQVVNTGGQTQIVQAGGLSAPRVTGSLANTMTPGEATTPTQWFDTKRNQMVTGTRAQYLQAQQSGTVSSQPGSGATGAGPNAAPGGNSGQPDIGLPAAPPLGAEAAATEAGSGSAKALNDDARQAATFGNRMFILNQALTGLQGAGNTGPGTDTRNTIMSYVQSLPLVGSVAKATGIVNPKEIKNYDEAEKYLTQYAMAQASSLGSGTDEKLATALTGNASTHISNLAAQDVVKANMALERMKQAAIVSFYGLPPTDARPENYNKYITKFSSSIDPRAFSVDLLAPDDRAKLLKTIQGAPKAEQQKFANSYNMGVHSGLIPDVSAPQAQAPAPGVQ